MTALAPLLHIWAREGEVADTVESLMVRPGWGSRLAYWDEAEGDRDHRGALWARMSQVLSSSGRPVGQPRRDLIHPARQHGLMLYQHCIVGACRARWPDGRHLYVVAPDEQLPDGRVRTARPPVCSAHAADYARTVPGHRAVLARSPAPSGVLGVVFEATAAGGVRVVEDGAERYVAYSDQDTLRWILATQLVRDLTGCEPIDDLDSPLRARQARASSAVGLPLHDLKDDSPS
ncbi:hypothetical protein HXS80_05655 [Streptomyces sp. CB04723]|uniref:hypothetical protein n=1 Tax=Streptomyces TaxID=1883 RepID=UPI0015C495A1|nr:hypothetical protein [Streptomyces sp. CB04723]QLG31237.1 hypothetical protein HXS80_05655 [Streptomyces sp. CB04723]